MEILYLIIGIVIGGVVAFLMMNSRKKDVDTKLMLTAQRLDQEEKVNAGLRQLADDEATKADEELCATIRHQNVLVIDDVTTSGSTLNEILRTLRILNEDNEIAIFSLIGRKDLMAEAV